MQMELILAGLSYVRGQTSVCPTYRQRWPAL